MSTDDPAETPGPHELVPVSRDRRSLLLGRMIGSVYVDTLTNTFSRRAFSDVLARALSQNGTSGGKLVLMLMDLDGMRQVNAALGEACGDEVLRTTADRLREALGSAVTVARWGSDEFAALIVTDADPAGLATTVAAGVSMPVLWQTHSVPVHYSLGYSVYPDDADSGEQLINATENALGRARRLGGGQAVRGAPASERNSLSRITLESELARAIAAVELQPFYQPFIDVSSGALRGFETLVRWPRADGRWIAPTRFIPLAEESGLIVGLERLMLELSLEQVHSWRQAGLRVPAMSINVSARRLQDRVVLADLRQALERRGLRAAGTLKLEVTETAMIADPELARTLLQELSEEGFLIALDDFGTGFSSLSVLASFPVDILKIDKSFVQAIGTNPRSERIVRAAIALGRELEMETVAEGIETEAQLAFLRHCHCEVAQGYLIDRPLDAGAFARSWLGGADAGAA